ncbi:hypothetical protein [Flavobacterium sp. 7A]|nr:hypothetical protein [Flavobacterium sp. 7A]MCW2120683.1 hypothetical protein [Flavobacterium sp. 7A]
MPKTSHYSIQLICTGLLYQGLFSKINPNTRFSPSETPFTRS